MLGTPPRERYARGPVRWGAIGGPCTAARLGRSLIFQERSVECVRAAAAGHPRTVEAWLELGCAHALLEHRADAIRAADRVKELSPLSADAYDGADSLLDQAQILARAGEVERAVATLEQLLSIPSTVSAAWLRLDPCWDPLRDNPAFKALLERSAPPGAP